MKFLVKKVKVFLEGTSNFAFVYDTNVELSLYINLFGEIESSITQQGVSLLGFTPRPDWYSCSRYNIATTISGT